MCDTITNQRNKTSFWSIQTECFQGNCMNNQCECIPGYEHDLVTYRQRDCRLPSMFYPIAGAIYLSISLLAVIFTGYHLKQSKLLARKIIIAAIIVEVTTLVFESMHYYNRHVLRGSTFFLIFLQVTSSSLLSSISSYALASPLCKISQTSPEKIRRELIVSFIFFRLSLFTIFVIAAVKYEDPNNLLNDDGWNTCHSLFQLITGVEVLFIVSNIALNGLRMIKVVEDISETVNKKNDKIMNEYIPKVRRTLNMQFYLSPIVFLLMTTTPIIQLSTGYLPGNYAIFFMLQTIILYIAVKRTRFGYVNKHRSDSARESKREQVNKPNINSLENLAVVAQVNQNSSVTPIY